MSNAIANQNTYPTLREYEYDEELQEFIDYCAGYYCSGGLRVGQIGKPFTRTEVTAACVYVRWSLAGDFEGDTFDRERVLTCLQLLRRKTAPRFRIEFSISSTTPTEIGEPWSPWGEPMFAVNEEEAERIIDGQAALFLALAQETYGDGVKMQQYFREGVEYVHEITYTEASEANVHPHRCDYLIAEITLA